MPDHQERKKSSMPAVVLKPQWQHNSRSLYLIIFQLNLGMFLQTTNISFFCQTRRLHTECACITLATLAGISVKDWHWFAGSREVKCSGSRTGRRLITTIWVQYNRCKILDRCTKEQVLKYSTFESSTFMNKKKDIRKGSHRREFSFDKSRRQAGKHLLTNRFLFVCLLKIDPKMS